MRMKFILTLEFDTSNSEKAGRFKNRILKELRYEFQLNKSELDSERKKWRYHLSSEIELSSFEDVVYETLLQIASKIRRYQLTGPMVDNDKLFFAAHWERGWASQDLHQCLELFDLIVVGEGR